jgi:hypothetical protein
LFGFVRAFDIAKLTLNKENVVFKARIYKIFKGALPGLLKRFTVQIRAQKHFANCMENTFLFVFKRHYWHASAP